MYPDWCSYCLSSNKYHLLINLHYENTYLFFPLSWIGKFHSGRCRFIFVLNFPMERETISLNARVEWKKSINFYIWHSNYFVSFASFLKLVQAVQIDWRFFFNLSNFYISNRTNTTYFFIFQLPLDAKNNNNVITKTLSISTCKRTSFK